MPSPVVMAVERFVAFRAAGEQHGSNQACDRADQRAKEKSFAFVFHKSPFYFHAGETFDGCQ